MINSGIHHIMEVKYVAIHVDCKLNGIRASFSFLPLPIHQVHFFLFSVWIMIERLYYESIKLLLVLKALTGEVLYGLLGSHSLMGILSNIYDSDTALNVLYSTRIRDSITAEQYHKD